MASVKEKEQQPPASAPASSAASGEPLKELDDADALLKLAADEDSEFEKLQKALDAENKMKEAAEKLAASRKRRAAAQQQLEALKRARLGQASSGMLVPLREAHTPSPVPSFPRFPPFASPLRRPCPSLFALPCALSRPDCAAMGADTAATSADAAAAASGGDDLDEKHVQPKSAGQTAGAAPVPLAVALVAAAANTSNSNSSSSSVASAPSASAAAAAAAPSKSESKAFQPGDFFKFLYHPFPVPASFFTEVRAQLVAPEMRLDVARHAGVMGSSIKALLAMRDGATFIEAYIDAMLKLWSVVAPANGTSPHATQMVKTTILKHAVNMFAPDGVPVSLASLARVEEKTEAKLANRLAADSQQPPPQPQQPSAPRASPRPTRGGSARRGGRGRGSNRPRAPRPVAPSQAQTAQQPQSQPMIGGFMAAQPQPFFDGFVEAPRQAQPFQLGHTFAPRGRGRGGRGGRGGFSSQAF
jgi:hypothetical protein